MFENDVIRSLIDERIARAAVLRRPAAPAPVTPGRVRVWGPRASMRHGPDPSAVTAIVGIPEPRAPRVMPGGPRQPVAGSERIEAGPSPGLPGPGSHLAGLPLMDA